MPFLPLSIFFPFSFVGAGGGKIKILTPERCWQSTNTGTHFALLFLSGLGGSAYVNT